LEDEMRDAGVVIGLIPGPAITLAADLSFPQPEL
jgi:hypothetical protein